MNNINSIHDEIDKLLFNKQKKAIDNIIKSEKKEIIKEVAVKKVDTKQVLDTIQEQVESPMTSIKCIESIKEKDLNLIIKNPENYIEINFIKEVRVVDSFFIPSNLKSFTYDNKTYNIIEENIYILPTKKGYFMPTCFYKENTFDPVDFRQKNKGITGKALSLLYEVKLYIDLFSGEEGKYNLFIVVLQIISISCFLVGLYFILGGRL